MNILVDDAYERNLKNISLEVPIGQITGIIGPSGSGKSTLAHRVIGEYAKRQYKILNGDATQKDIAFKPSVNAIFNIPNTKIIKQDKIPERISSTIATYTGIQTELINILCKYGNIIGDSGTIISKPTIKDVRKFLQKYHPYIDEIFIVYCHNQTHTFCASLYQKLKDLSIGKCILVSSFDNEFKEISINRLNKLSNKFTYSVLVPIKLNVFDYSIYEATEIDNAEYAIYLNNEIIYFESEYFDINNGKFYQKASHQLLSFNSTSINSGKCSNCNGTGITHLVNWDKLLIKDIALEEGFINLTKSKDIYKYIYLGINELNHDLKINGISLTKTFNELSAKEQKYIQEKIAPFVLRHTNNNNICSYVSEIMCNFCNGSRLNYKARAIRLNENNLTDLLSYTPNQLISFLELNNYKNETLINKLNALVISNIEYLALNRSTDTLSGGELQRLKIAHEIYNNSTGLLYIIDEPSSGLHPYDVDKLQQSISCLNKMGNTILLVEHNYDMLSIADNIIELGYGAGHLGGEVVPYLNSVLNHSEEINHVRKKLIVNMEDSIILNKVNINNINNQSFKFPLNCLISVTGVSGSGKSSLINKYLYEEIRLKTLGLRSPNQSIIPNSIKSIISLSQSNNKSNSRSVVATYIGAFEIIRKVYAELGTIYGLTPGMFSFNSSGACDICCGVGELDDVVCHSCFGKRFKPEILTIKLNGLNISEFLETTISKVHLLEDKLGYIVTTLKKLGLGHLTFGTLTNSLSGGERQRLRLAELLISNFKLLNEGGLLIIFDEPTQGLNILDIISIINIFDEIIAKGNSIICIEHNKYIIENSDFIIDVGPLSGHMGGRNVFSGDYRGLINCDASITGGCMKKEQSKLTNINRIINCPVPASYSPTFDYSSLYINYPPQLRSEKHFDIESDFHKEYSVITDSEDHLFFKNYKDLENFVLNKELLGIFFNPYTNYLHKFHIVPKSIKKQRIMDMIIFFNDVKKSDYTIDEWDYRITARSLQEAYIFGNGWVTITTPQKKYELFTRVISLRDQIIGSQNISTYTFNLYANRCLYCNGASKLYAYDLNLIFESSLSVLDTGFFKIKGIRLKLKSIIDKFKSEGLFDFTKKYNDMHEYEKNIFLFGFVEYEFLKNGGNKNTIADYLYWDGIYKIIYENITSLTKDDYDMITNSKKAVECPFCTHGFNNEVSYLTSKAKKIFNFFNLSDSI